MTGLRIRPVAVALVGHRHPGRRRPSPARQLRFHLVGRRVGRRLPASERVDAGAAAQPAASAGRRGLPAHDGWRQLREHRRSAASATTRRRAEASSRRTAIPTIRTATA